MRRSAAWAETKRQVRGRLPQRHPQLEADCKGSPPSWRSWAGRAERRYRNLATEQQYGHLERDWLALKRTKIWPRRGTARP